MKIMRRILIIDNSSSVTGAFRSISTVILAIPKSFIFHFCGPTNSLSQQLKTKIHNVFKIPFLEIQKNWSLFIYFPVLFINSYKIIRYSKINKIDIVHVNDLYNMVGVILKIFLPNIKLVYHVRLLPGSYAAPLYNIWLKLITRYADAIICVSKKVYKSLPSSNKKKIIYDAIAAPIFGNLIKSDTFTFIYVANFIEGKGQNHAIEAFAKTQLKGAKLIFVGGDMSKEKNKVYKNNLSQKVASLNLTSQIIFLDFVSDIYSQLQKAHVSLVFSESESFSMVTLESLMNKIPVIATRCGGPEEIIEDKVNGILVDNRNIDQMAKAMVTLYQNEELRKDLTKNTELVLTKFSISTSANALAKIYNDLC